MSHICARHIDGVLVSETWKQLLADNGAIGLLISKVAHREFLARYAEMEKKLEGAAAELESIRSVAVQLGEADPGQLKGHCSIIELRN